MAHADLLISLEKICMLVTITYLASRTDAFARLMLQKTRRRDRLAAYLFFICLSIAEVLLAPHNPLMDARVVTATAAGLLAGISMGVSVGLTTVVISVLHSPWSLLDGAPAVVAGVLGGLFFRYRPAYASKVLAGFLVGSLAHGLWLAIRLQSDHLVGAWDSILVGHVLPMFLSGAGVALFLVIMGDLRAQRQKMERSELARAMRLANTAPRNLSTRLDEAAAEHIATLVLRLAGVPAVAVAVEGELLAHVGQASDYHLKSQIIPDVAVKAMEDGERHVTEKRAAWCDHPGCPFGSAVAAPLRYRDRVIGSVVLFEVRGARLRPEVIDLGAETAQFFVNHQLQAAELADQAQAISRAELKALQAQVHPHFLFNALNTLASLCEIRPNEAARLTVKLGEFFRSSFHSEREVISTVAEELAVVRSYLEIEKARFREKLEVVEETDPEVEDCPVPSFSLQPLVENAIVHGVSRKSGQGRVRIVIRIRNDRLHCWVQDNGRGFDARGGRWRNSGSHALSILDGRLGAIYGDDYRLIVRSRKERGTLVCIQIPVQITR